MITIAVLLTVFNRKEKTLKCLENLYCQELPDAVKMDVYLTNDGCTDGTPEAVACQFPQVHIINADGNLFWNRGMYTAWEVAAKTYDYDYYLWLNDDTYLFSYALKTLLSESNEVGRKAVIVAVTTSGKKYNTTYGGYNNNGLIEPNGTLQECSTFNGNCVLIPQYVFHKIGNLDWAFHHAIGDMDYGYRVNRKGLKTYVSSKYLGICEKNPKLPAWTRKEVPLFKRIKNLYSPLGYAEPLPFFKFELRNFGILTAVKHFLSIHIRVLLPWLWKN